MENFIGEISIPSVEQICDVNRRILEQSGGRFVPPRNLHNVNPLEYILEAITHSVFEHDIFPSLKEKAAALAFEIIASHVFIDGNKRTGIHIAWEFLQSNGVEIYINMSIVDLSVRLAEGDANSEELIVWLHEHQ